MYISGFIKRHPIVTYFTMAFMISWIGIFVAVGSKFFQGEAMQFTDALFMFLPMLAGPSLAGVTLTGIVDGKRGFRDLFSRMGLWRVGVHWYSLILVFPFLIIIVLLALTALFSPKFAPNFFPEGILIGLVAGFFEEIGWMGYAYPKMQLRYSALASSLFTN
jgi:membrane protease YdiL (CAAX protease family)